MSPIEFHGLGVVAGIATIGVVVLGSLPVSYHIKEGARSRLNCPTHAITRFATQGVFSIVLSGFWCEVPRNIISSDEFPIFIDSDDLDIWGAAGKPTTRA
jgi:hypothetical protein